MAESKKSVPVKAIILVVVFIIVLPLLPIFISGQWGWWQVWLYAGISVVSFILSRAVAGKKNPGLLQERAQFGEQDDAESWDKVLSPLVGFGGVIILIVAGLDARFGWTATIPVSVQIVGLLVHLLGHVLGGYALVENTFFSGMVRLQEERGHHVIDSGPYAWVRHPGYAGALLTYIGTPLLLNSWWGFIPAAFMFAVLILRTAKEDRFLQENLEGYKEFTQKTKYRLFPGIW